MAFVSLAFFAAACSERRSAVADHASLNILSRLSARLGSTTAIYGGTVAYALAAAGSRIYVTNDFDHYRRWTETARCKGRVFRWLDRVSFPQAERRRYDHALRVPPSHYFIRFVPGATGGRAQAPDDFPITVR